MPDVAEVLLLVLVGGGVAALVATPFVRERTRRSPPSDHGEATADDPEVLVIRHRVALEALRDVEADHRAGSIDESAYAEQLADAERRAAETLAELEAARAVAGEGAAGPAPRPVPRRLVAVVAGVVGLALLVGFAIPPPYGIGNPTETNQALAAAESQEAARQATISQLLQQVAANPRDTNALSKLADAYLAGSSADDLSRGATILLALLSIDPQNTSAYRRLITAYVNAGDWTDAASATDAYAGVAPGSADIPFFRGIIALRGRNDPAAAIDQFKAFLALAPDDPRATMVRALLSEAESPAPSA
jgi:tetratricopeptide (TPR) repeat protein